jgi:hypothetical protein
MNCESFDHWLDEGRPVAEAAAAEAHAASCARCGRALAASLAIERALEGEAAPAPAGFTARVMERVRESNRLPMAVRSLADLAPWWVRVAAEPGVLLAAAVAGLVAWRPDALLALGAAAAQGLSTRMGFGASALENLIGTQAPAVDPNVRLTLWITAAPLVILASVVLYRWSEHLALRNARNAV